MGFKYIIVAIVILMAVAFRLNGTPASTLLPNATSTDLALPTDSPTASSSITLLPTLPSTRTPAAPESGTPAPRMVTTSPVPAFSHIYVILMENKEYNQIVDSRNAPYLKSLIDQYGLATGYTSLAHPSQPNYLALFSGSTQGVVDDGRHNVDAVNLADQLEQSGKSWKIFAQNVPLNCFMGLSASGGEDGPGTYARKHNPAISFVDINTSPTRCGNITDFSHFDPDTANFELIAPNMCNVMHDCSVDVGDSFLQEFIPRILNSVGWQQGGVLFIGWDEGMTNTGGGGHVPMLVIAKNVAAGFQSADPHDHYSLLRTIEDAWGLGCLENSCTANNLGEFFR